MWAVYFCREIIIQLTIDHNQSVKAIISEFVLNADKLKQLVIQWQDNFKPNLIYGRYELRYENDIVLVRVNE